MSILLRLMKNVTYATPLKAQINFQNVCCNKMMILSIPNKLHFTISENDAYRSAAMFIYMKKYVSTYLNGWGNLVCILSLIIKMISLGLILNN